MIELNNLYPWYDILYKAGFVFGLIYLLIAGRKAKINSISWLLFLATTIILAIIGSRVGTYGFTEWSQLLTQGHFSNFGQKTAIGGILGAAVAIIIFRKPLGVDKNAIDLFAFYLPFLMLFQRAGCLMAGCCFGLPTQSIVGIKYSGFSFIRDHHIQEGWIKHSDFTTVAVHPIPIYFIVVSILTIVALLLFGKYLKIPGSKLQLSMLLLGFGRFIIEFFRDPVTNHQLGTEFFGIKLVQWVIGIGIIIGVLLLYKRERSVNALRYSETKPQAISFQRSIVAVSVLLGFMVLANPVFESGELFVIQLMVVLALIEVIRKTLPIKGFLVVKPVSFILLVGALGLMSQTYRKDVTRDSNGVQTIISGKLGYQDLLVTQYPCKTVGQGCLGPTCIDADTSSPMGPSYAHANFGVDRYKDIKINADLNYGLNGQLEFYRNGSLGFNAYRFNVHPYIGLDGKQYFGGRVGLRFGNIYSNGLSNDGNVYLVPTGRLWFGYKDAVSVQVSVFDSEFGGPYVTPAELRLNMNFSRLTKNKIGQVGIGYAGNTETMAWFMQTEIYPTKNTAIVPRFGVTRGEDYLNSKHLKGFLFGFGFRANLQPR
jgi:phosphatidylglycerol:prolipoprotein diacylglycerol transferase